ncbi:MAG TPA: MBL fold metallo-hydrolase [Bacillota bacterium]|nr:MBL fold metallo-hydrolase [Bacillota bacterium]
MLKICKIPVPTPYLSGPLNSYLIMNRPYTLVDPGPETEVARKSLVEGLASLGVDVADIARIVLTHSHPDHCGLAGWLAGLCGAAVYVHGLELRKLARDYDYYGERLPFLIEAGLPPGALKELFDDPDPVPKPYLDHAGVEILNGGETLDFEEGPLRIMHFPGHACGHLCLYEPAERIFLAGDFILRHITPNPVMEPDPSDLSKRLPVLKQYLDGLNGLKNLDVRLILPGHGKNIDNSREAADKAEKHHATRLKAVTSILAGGGSFTAYQVMRVLYPEIRGFQIYLGISEVFAHLDFLLAGGVIKREERGGVSFYRSAF